VDGKRLTSRPSIPHEDIEGDVTELADHIERALSRIQRGGAAWQLVSAYGMMRARQASKGTAHAIMRDRSTHG
jgi:hypothetical protein